MGAVVAIAGPVAALMIGGTLVINNGVATHVSCSCRWPLLCALPVALFCGLWNGLLVAKIGLQPIATLILKAVALRNWPPVGKWSCTTHPTYGNGFLWGLPFALFIAAGSFLIAGIAGDTHGVGVVHPGHRHQPGAACWPGSVRG